MADENLEKFKSASKKVGIAMAIYSSASIFGPLIIFATLGLILDWKFSTNHLFTFGGIFIAFIMTNVLLYKKFSAFKKDFKNSAKEIKK